MKLLKSTLKKSLTKFGSRTKEEILFHVVPHFLAEIMTKYFRVKVEGDEHIPKKGASLIASNHSGYSGFDAFLLCHHVHKKTKRTARVLTHKSWFLTKTTSIPANKLGFIEASRENGIKTLKKDKILLIFPEGEEGNFKPTSQRYQLQRFKTGLVRMALETKAPIVPVVVIGAEETHINLAKLKFTKFIKLILPLPLNIIPLPAKWKLKFLPSYPLKYGKEALKNESMLNELCEDLHLYMQASLNAELEKRKNIFL